MRKWRAENPIRAVFKQLQHRAKRRFKEFTLTLEEFTRWYQENALDQFPRGNTANCISIDRIDHTKGYSIDNIQSLTVSENSRKWHHHDYHSEQRDLNENEPF
jgi:hypothetical protein